MKFEKKHYAVLAGFLAAVATQLATAQHGWVDISTPGFVAGVLMQLATTISALFVGSPSDKDGGSSVDPKRFLGVILLIGTLGIAAPLIPACAHPPTLTTPAGQAAYTADEVVKRIVEIQQAVIDATDAGKVKVTDARVIVTWTKTALQALQQTPNGWRAIAVAGYPQVRLALRASTLTAPYVAIIDGLLNYTEGA